MLNPVQTSIDKLAPNKWNPNRMSAHTWRVFKSGMKRDGWITSQSILACKGPAGTPLIIIDGEHRWRAAKELGYETVPVVVLENVTVDMAKALTVELNSKRGAFDKDELAALVRNLSTQPSDGDLADELGFTAEDFSSYLTDEISVPDEPQELKPAREPKSEKETDEFGSVQLFFTGQEKNKFLELEQKVLGLLAFTKAHEALREACMRALQ